jgi:2-phosphosulfolactate phosphatase
MLLPDIPREGKTLEVCFSPRLYQDRLTTGDHIVVVADILRATTAMAEAFHQGAEAIIPVASAAEAKRWQALGYPVAGEQDGKTLDFADFGNSPLSFTRENISGKTLVYLTTNGTYTLNLVRKDCRRIAIGAFINLSALCEWLTRQSAPVVILCAGWKNRFCIEDALFAGALTERLTSAHGFFTSCDAAIAAMELWALAQPDPVKYAHKASHVHRLHRLDAGDSIPYAFTRDTTRSVPVYDGKEIRNVEP